MLLVALIRPDGLSVPGMDELMPPPPTPIEVVCKQAGIFDCFAQQRVRAWLREEVEKRRIMRDESLRALDYRVEQLEA
jgi:hypothetical protein